MRALMLLAFLVNFAAYPLVGSLLAYVAKDVYGSAKPAQLWLIACFAAGALAGSIAISTHGAHIRPARTMLVCAVAWFTSISSSPDRKPFLGRSGPVRCGFRPEISA